MAQNSDAVFLLSTRALKHLYDKKPAEEFHAVLRFVHLVVQFPDKIYKNKMEKHADICFVKRVRGSEYFCALQKIENTFFIVTCFRLRDPDYIKNYTLLWNRGSGKPHRHALETKDAPQ